MATDLARTMVCEWGMSDELGPLHFGKRRGARSSWAATSATPARTTASRPRIEIDAEVRQIVTANYERANKVVMENLDKLKLLAEALLEYETVDGADIDTIFAGRPPRTEAARRARRAGHATAKPPRRRAPRSAAAAVRKA